MPSDFTPLWLSREAGRTAGSLLMSNTIVSSCQSLPAMTPSDDQSSSRHWTHCGSFRCPQGNKCQCDSRNLHSSEDVSPCIWPLLLTPLSLKTRLIRVSLHLWEDDLARILSVSGLALSAASLYIWSGRSTETLALLLVVVHQPLRSGKGAEVKFSTRPTWGLLTTFKVKMRTPATPPSWGWTHHRHLLGDFRYLKPNLSKTEFLFFLPNWLPPCLSLPQLMATPSQVKFGGPPLTLLCPLWSHRVGKPIFKLCPEFCQVFQPGAATWAP